MHTIGNAEGQSPPAINCSPTTEHSGNQLMFISRSLSLSQTQESIAEWAIATYLIGNLKSPGC